MKAYYQGDRKNTSYFQSQGLSNNKLEGHCEIQVPQLSQSNWSNQFSTTNGFTIDGLKLENA